ncbi:hypothetical protein GALMADRAFT_222923 [Galerina marginata CBS 339.88]|uniref:Uncharacterized protein n=1 Tax=Galerina marginata (strain CBS 339.88) TaxID=685588 RepID=A0A067TJC7_GALM3|nr:hypothetical protein GALMADRAFT_222923 [Galerina marginata CBS 339.88]
MKRFLNPSTSLSSLKSKLTRDTAKLSKPSNSNTLRGNIFPPIPNNPGPPQGWNFSAAPTPSYTNYPQNSPMVSQQPNYGSYPSYANYPLNTPIPSQGYPYAAHTLPPSNYSQGGPTFPQGGGGYSYGSPPLASYQQIDPASQQGGNFYNYGDPLSTDYQQNTPYPSQDPNLYNYEGTGSTHSLNRRLAIGHRIHDRSTFPLNFPDMNDQQFQQGSSDGYSPSALSPHPGGYRQRSKRQESD